MSITAMVLVAVVLPVAAVAVEKAMHHQVKVLSPTSGTRTARGIMVCVRVSTISPGVPVDLVSAWTRRL
jgi:hypothetical protein